MVTFKPALAFCKFRYHWNGTPVLVEPEYTKERKVARLSWIAVQDQGSDLTLVGTEGHGLNLETIRYCGSPEDRQMKQLKGVVVRYFNGDGIVKRSRSQVIEIWRYCIHPELFEVVFVFRDDPFANRAQHLFEVTGLHLLHLASNDANLVFVVLDRRISKLWHDVRPAERSFSATKSTPTDCAFVGHNPKSSRKESCV